MSPNAASMFTPGILFNISIKPLMACLKMLTMPSQAALAMLDQPPIESNQSDNAVSWPLTQLNASLLSSALVHWSQ